MGKKNIEGALVGTMAFLCSVSIMFSLSIVPSRQIDSDQIRSQKTESLRITKTFDGSLRMGNLVDENADGIADYIRYGVAVGRPPMGYEVKEEVPKNLQEKYQEVYRNSKFYKK